VYHVVSAPPSRFQMVYYFSFHSYSFIIVIIIIIFFPHRYFHLVRARSVIVIINRNTAPPRIRTALYEHKKHYKTHNVYKSRDRVRVFVPFVRCKWSVG
jgi:hypothetical protein